MKQLNTTFASATGALLMLGSNALAQGFFERPYIQRPPADIGYPQTRRVPLPVAQDQGAIIRQDLPPPTSITPPAQKNAVANLCDEALKARFCIPKPEEVADPRNLPEGQIFVMDDEKALYLSLGAGKAVRYKVATAMAQEKMPRGTYVLSSKSGGQPIDGQIMYGMAKNPQWCPTNNIAKQKGYPKGYCVPGTDKSNPFGGVALYLAYTENGEEKQTLFRIHGTTDPKKIGDNVSSGCVRMYTPDAQDLYARVLDMRIRNVMIGISVPQGPTREEYAATQRAITARINQQYDFQNDPYYDQRVNGRAQSRPGQRNFFEQLFGL